MTEKKNHEARTIGIFDSGVGGLSVLRAIREQRPDIGIRYVADQAHVPYGPRPLEQVRLFAKGITEYLLQEGSQLIVAACNAASAAALYSLRETWPSVPFVGMEPALKPAATVSSTGIVGVLATPATFQGELYASVLERFASNVKVLTSVCEGLVQSIEAGDTEGPKAMAILEEALAPMMAAGADTIVLGCTHYPFAIPAIQSIVGPSVQVIDPSPAIARQVDKLISESFPLPFPGAPEGQLRLCTTGAPSDFAKLASALLGQEVQASGLRWIGDGRLGPAGLI